LTSRKCRERFVVKWELLHAESMFYVLGLRLPDEDSCASCTICQDGFPLHRNEHGCELGPITAPPFEGTQMFLDLSKSLSIVVRKSSL
jgi:hypothetical protein